ncbi:MAG: hypothetical protein AAGF30_04015 [Pseudomonadota bacterium]
MQAYLTIDGVRALLVLLLAIGQALAAYWPDIRKWDNTITSRSQNLDTPVVPFGPFFAIWLIIFASCIAFAIWHALPGNLHDPYLRSVGWLAAALFAGNIAWEAYVPRYGFRWPSFFLIVLELALALILIAVMRSLISSLTSVEFWLGAAPLYFFAGWVSVATVVSLSSTLVLHQSRVNPRKGKFAASLIIAAGLFVTAISIWTGSWVYAASAIWGLLGVVVGARVKNEPSAAIFAATASIAFIMGVLTLT